MKPETFPQFLLTYYFSFSYLLRHATQGEGGGLGEGRETGFREKTGREEMKSAARPGHSHRSLTTRGRDGRERKRGGRGCGMPVCMTAEGVRRFIDPIQKAVEGGASAVARTELGEGGTEVAGKKFLLICHHWRRNVKEFVGEREAIARVIASMRGT